MDYTIKEYENNYDDDCSQNRCFKCNYADDLAYLYDDLKINKLSYDCEDAIITIFCGDCDGDEEINIQIINYLVKTYSIDFNKNDDSESDIDDYSNIWKHEHMQSLLETLTTMDDEYEHMFIYQLLKRNDFSSIKILNDLGYCSTIESKFNLNKPTEIKKNKLKILKYFYEIYNSKINEKNKKKLEKEKIESLKNKLLKIINNSDYNNLENIYKLINDNEKEKQKNDEKMRCKNERKCFECKEKVEKEIEVKKCENCKTSYCQNCEDDVDGYSCWNCDKFICEECYSEAQSLMFMGRNHNYCEDCH